MQRAKNPGIGNKLLSTFFAYSLDVPPSHADDRT
jgi:hypothetical protein